jgi:group II intron reverse transcriptase/maturase
MNLLKDNLKGGIQLSLFERLSNRERVYNFQRKIYQKAKQEKSFKFYRLYDKIYLNYFLKEAYRKVKQNDGAAGVDKQTFKDIENKGLEIFLQEISEELKTFSYKPQAVKRVWIEKANGKLRPLGIPTIKDRVVQMSCKMVIEPIFEADFSEHSFGFRPNRNSAQAVTEIKTYLKEGKTEVYDADLSAYFDTIPHDKLLKALAERISDHDVLRVIKLWLQSPVSENGRITGGKSNKLGTPQGGVISPLLANIYLNLFDRNIEKEKGIFEKEGVKLVRYADDFVLLARKISEGVKQGLNKLLERLDLKLNPDKTGVKNAKDKGGFDFLGFNFRYDKSLYNKGQHYWKIHPSKRSEIKFRKTISEFLTTRLVRPMQEVVKGLNNKIRGYYQYFKIRGISNIKQSLGGFENYLMYKLYKYSRRKSQRMCKRYSYNVYNYLTEYYGLIKVVTIT